MDEIEELKKLHFEFRQLIETKNWGKLNKRLKEIRNAHDVNKSKTVLIITQSLVNNINILEERYLLYQQFVNDVGWVNLSAFKQNDNNVPDKYKDAC
jgi:hypothetical protein